MRNIGVFVVILLGLLLFIPVKMHFSWSPVYLLLHLVIIAFAKHRLLAETKIPLVVIPLLFVSLQLVYSLFQFVEINQMGLEPVEARKLVYYNLLRIGILVVEYPLIVEFFRKPRFNRY